MYYKTFTIVNDDKSDATMELCIIETNAGKQQSQAATDV
jgi:hypothetical protein